MKKLFIILACTGGLMGCASETEIVTEMPLPEIYANAYSEFNDENYEAAANEFIKAETQYPASAWAPDALVMAAYSYYMDEDFAGTLLVTDRFMRFHPGHKDAPYVMYLLQFSPTLILTNNSPVAFVEVMHEYDPTRQKKSLTLNVISLSYLLYS